MCWSPDRCPACRRRTRIAGPGAEAPGALGLDGARRIERLDAVRRRRLRKAETRCRGDGDQAGKSKSLEHSGPPSAVMGIRRPHQQRCGSASTPAVEGGPYRDCRSGAAVAQQVFLIWSIFPPVLTLMRSSCAGLTRASISLANCGRDMRLDRTLSGLTMNHRSRRRRGPAMRGEGARHGRLAVSLGRRARRSDTYVTLRSISRGASRQYARLLCFVPLDRYENH
jgi:hypothetical protein